MKYLQVKFERNYRASATVHKQVAEWPPAPWRMYCALVNAYYKATRSGFVVDRNILLEFEKRLPVILTTNQVVEKKQWNRYVSSNIPISRQTGENKNKFNNVLTNYPFVVADRIWFGWDVSEDVWTETLKLLNWISHLGTEDSVVRVSNEPPPNGYFVAWQPTSYKGKQLNCPYKGCLQHLDLAKEHGFRVEPALEFYSYNTRQQVVDGDFYSPKQIYQWESFYIFTIDEDEGGVHARCASPLTADLRTAIGEEAGNIDCGDLKKEVLSHEARDHISYLALPAILGDYASGEIKGVAICLPKSLASFRSDLEKCLWSLQNKTPSFKSRYGTMKLSAPRPIKALSGDFWGGMSRRWASATPLDIAYYNFRRSPKESEEESRRRFIEESSLANERYIKQECAFRGLPEPLSIKLSVKSRWGEGIDFKCRDKSKKENFDGFMIHVTEITFPIMVKGPIVLGRGRNFGLGLMYPIWDRARED